MYPRQRAQETPDKPATIMAETGEQVTYRELDSCSVRLAQLLRSRGIGPGDGIAILMENHLRFPEVAWAAQRSGLYYTPISYRLTEDEVAYILNDSGAKALVVSARQRHLAARAADQAPGVLTRLVIGDPGEGFESYDEVLALAEGGDQGGEIEGSDLLYSSGTTGQPKGVKLPLQGRPIGTPDGLTLVVAGLYGATSESVYLSPAPLYHAAPLRFSMAFQRLGATDVIMESFDAERYLAAMERFHVTHTQLVPTMFIRMLKLPEEVRSRYDLSSLQCAVHAAAPCPVPVKEEMIAWWGPIIHEYYAGTEGNGFCAIDSKEWLAHRGSVGRPITGAVHILDENGDDVPTGQQGFVFFEGGNAFEYLNDSAKTASTRDIRGRGWTTLGDVGRLDEDGYLYLTDRASFMIVSGGVNIYPQEVENVLVTHPLVMDAAVFGIPDPEMGEQVKAVVELVDGSSGSPSLAALLVSFCKEHLASYKCPRSIDFTAELPRHPNGKLYKRVLRDPYWEGRATRIL